MSAIPTFRSLRLSANAPLSQTAATVAKTRSAAGLTSTTSTHEFAPGPPATWTTATPAGSQMQVTLDNKERVTQIAALGLTDPLKFLPRGNP